MTVSELLPQLLDRVALPASPKKPSEPSSKVHSRPGFKNRFFDLPLELRQQTLLHTTQPPSYDKEWTEWVPTTALKKPHPGFEPLHKRPVSQQQFLLFHEEYRRIITYYKRQYRILEIRARMWRKKFLAGGDLEIEQYEWVYEEWMKEWEALRGWILDVKSGGGLYG